jgi:catechol 2,3-dioxygenase-like lactoylglutathione lyase family enzyme
MPEKPPRLERVLETVLYFTDEERTERFYSEVLGMRLLSREQGRSLFYRAGESVFLLFNAATTLAGDSLPAHGATGPVHTCFLVPPADYPKWKDHLASHRIPILKEVAWSAGQSFYFHDPDGNVLEIANTDIWPR